MKEKVMAPAQPEQPRPTNVDRPHSDEVVAEHVEQLASLAEKAEKAGHSVMFTPAGHLRVDLVG